MIQLLVNKDTRCFTSAGRVSVNIVSIADLYIFT